jgi:hypothetical protein
MLRGTDREANEEDGKEDEGRKKEKSRKAGGRIGSPHCVVENSLCD